MLPDVELNEAIGVEPKVVLLLVVLEEIAEELTVVLLVGKLEAAMEVDSMIVLLPVILSEESDTMLEFEYSAVDELLPFNATPTICQAVHQLSGKVCPGHTIRHRNAQYQGSSPV